MNKEQKRRGDQPPQAAIYRDYEHRRHKNTPQITKFSPAALLISTQLQAILTRPPCSMISECLIVALVEAKFLREISTLLELNRETDGWVPPKPYVNKSFFRRFLEQ